MPPLTMKLRILLPFGVHTEREGVSRIVAMSSGGAFGLWPHRLDCVAELTPGILEYSVGTDSEVYVAIDEGILVKTGPHVVVAVRNATSGDSLAQLREAVEREFVSMDEQDRAFHSVMAKMETGLLVHLGAIRHE